jgi:hypothetical protein
MLLPAKIPAVDEEPIDVDLERVLRRLDDEGEQDGECRLWPETGCNDQGYAVVSMANRMVRTYRWLYEHEHGALPKGWTLDHTCHNEARARGECAGGKTCRHRRCCELEHLEALPRGENSQRRHEQPGVRSQAASTAASTIALFAGIDRPAVEPKMVSLDELRQFLSKFEVLADKRRGRCWSPTIYADGQATRGNAGVAAVSCLVFDCDRVSPDAERLAGVYWIGHTTPGRTSPQRHAGAWSFRSPSRCRPPSGPMCGDAPGQRCAPKRTPPAKTRVGSTTCPAIAAASRPGQPAMTARCWIRRRCQRCRQSQSGWSYIGCRRQLCCAPQPIGTGAALPRSWRR